MNGLIVLVIVYSQDMAKKKSKQSSKVISRRTRLIILPIFGVIAIGTAILVVITIIVMPRADSNDQRGVGADGFRAFLEKDGDIGVARAVTKSEVVAALGNKAKSVSDVDVTKVINIGGNRGQTATYPFVRTDNTKVNLYIDVMMFKNITSLEDANVYRATLDAGKINGRQAYYLHAQTIGSDREYRLMIVNGLKVYKFVMVQPYRSITINEVAALAVLKRLAAKAEL